MATPARGSTEGQLRDWVDTLRGLLTSSYVQHLESEIAYLRGHNAQLLLQLTNTLAPKPAVHVNNRELLKVNPKPVKTNWEVYLAEQIALQEREEQEEDGAHSSGRQ